MGVARDSEVISDKMKKQRICTYVANSSTHNPPPLKKTAIILADMQD